MKRWRILWFPGTCFILGNAREPFRPKEGSLPFIVYFPSRYRGICVGTLVSRTAVITAAVCVSSSFETDHDTRPINVVTGATYRHPRRGIRVQVTKILLPHLPDDGAQRSHMVEKSPAILLLKRKVPDILTEIPLRALDIDYKGDEKLSLQEECLMPGWHFFYKGDKIYPVHQFLLQRNIRVQFLNIVKMTLWCEALSMKFQKALSNLGYISNIDNNGWVCARDPDRTAQPCHGMYGAPLICRGKAVGLMMAPDAQWTNCTGYSNIIHLFSSSFLKKFMQCASSLFEVDDPLDWVKLKKTIYPETFDGSYEYVEEMYGKIGSESTSDEM